MRRNLYRLASLFGDLNALARGTILQRVIRKVCWKLFSGLMAKVIK